VRTTRVIVTTLALLLASCSGDDAVVFVTGTLPQTTTPTATTTTPATTTIAAQPSVELGVWRPMAESPLGARDSALAVWTGSELLIMGGRALPPCSPPGLMDCFVIQPFLSDGAAFDPAANEWRRIAPAPVPLVGPPLAVFQGDAVYLWVRGPQQVLWAAPETTRAFLAYYPEEDRWERLPTPEAGFNPILAAAGGHLVLYEDSTAPLPPEVAPQAIGPDLRFDPATREWVPLPPDPLQPSYDRRMVWTGTELVLIGLDATGDSSASPRLYQAAAYDIDRGTWRRLPDSEIHAGGRPTWYWVDGRIVNPSLGATDGGVDSNYGRSYDQGGMLVPVAEVWWPLPDAPDPAMLRLGAFLHYTAGGADYLLTHYGWLFAPGTGLWLPIDAPPGGTRIGQPLGARWGGRVGAAVAWAGPDLIVWGGAIAVPAEDGLVATLTADGWMLRPDPDAVVPEVFTYFFYLPPDLPEVAFEFEAPDPATHYFDVRIELPDFADVRLRFETDAVTLQVFRGVDFHHDSCTTEYDQVTCILHFPALEAPSSGPWSAVITKLSPLGTTVAVEITWYPVGE
jgi:hypothetical protein